MALTRASIKLVTPEPYVSNSIGREYTGVLEAGASTITVGEGPQEGEGILVFLSGICQNSYTVNNNIITLPEAVAEATEYKVVIGVFLSYASSSGYGLSVLNNRNTLEDVGAGIYAVPVEENTGE